MGLVRADFLSMEHIVQRFHALALRHMWYLDKKAVQGLLEELVFALNSIADPLEAYKDESGTGFRNACNMLGVEVHKDGDTDRQWSWPFDVLRLNHPGIVCFMMKAEHSESV